MNLVSVGKRYSITITVDKSVKALSGTKTTSLEQVTGEDPSKPPTVTFTC